MISSNSKLCLLNLSTQVLGNVFKAKQIKILLFSLKVVEICWWKTNKSVKKTFHSTFSRMCRIYRRVTENNFVRVSKSSPTITIFWAFIYIMKKNENFFLGLCIAFFDISFLGVACAEVIFIILNRSRSDRRSKWNVFKSIEIMQ